MPKAVELFNQGRNEDLWQMCCGFLKLDITQFMAIQERLLAEQLELLNRSGLGEKIMRGMKPKTMDEFRSLVPLTTYADYCPDLLDRREDFLPSKPAQWAHTSGKSGEYARKWIPITESYSRRFSEVLYGLGILAGCKDWGDISMLSGMPKILYTVAPKPYISGVMADVLQMQTPLQCLPSFDEAESLHFEDRIKLGCSQAMSKGIDFFFGMSLVLVVVGEKINNSSGKLDIRPYLSQPRALCRLGKGLIKSKMARRSMLPKDLWSVKGIISSGIDSVVYKDRIKDLWGKQPLDIYAATEGGVIATQTWDYEGMAFIPNLNFLEFIPEKEHFKLQADHSYQPATVLLDEVVPGEKYEVVLTNFHGGALVRYRIGDMVRITSLRNEKLGIATPQMVFERRVDDLMDFVVVRLTERTIWQALENASVPYKDWVAYKDSGKSVLRLFVELNDEYQATEADVARAIYCQVMNSDDSDMTDESPLREDFAGSIDFSIEVTFMPEGTFDNYTARRRAEGAELAHLKPPHVNPSPDVLSKLMVGVQANASGAEQTETETTAVS